MPSGDQRVDDKKLAAIYNVGRKKVRTASPDQCMDTVMRRRCTAAGTSHTRIANLYERFRLKRYEQLYAAGGAHNAIFPITLVQLEQITHGQFADVAKRFNPINSPQIH